METESFTLTTDSQTGERLEDYIQDIKKIIMGPSDLYVSTGSRTLEAYINVYKVSNLL